MKFEIHITGNEAIHEAAKKIGLRTITIDLLTPEGNILRTEHMTSEVRDFASFTHALCATGTWKFGLIAHGAKVFRTKVEAPPLETFFEQAIYVESHFPSNLFLFPTSRSHHKMKNLATAREYDHKKYRNFVAEHSKAGHEVEVVLHDSWQEEDEDWFRLWDDNSKYVVPEPDEVHRGERGNFKPSLRGYRQRF